MGQRRVAQLRGLGAALVAGAGCCVAGALTAGSWLGIVIYVCGCLTVLCLAAVTWDMSRLLPADSHSPLTLILQYAMYRGFFLLGWKIYLSIEMSCMDCEETQAKLLRDIVNKNKDTDFGRKHNFSSIKTLREYTKKIPLSTYADYKGYIEKIEAGEQGVLTADQVVYLAQSSGTTGKSKRIPITCNMKGPAAKKFGPLMYYIMDQKSGLTLQRTLVLSYRQPVSASPGGLPCGPVTAHMNRYMPFVVSPPESYSVCNETAAIHIHAVFGFRDAEVGHLEALMSTLMYSFWKYAEKHWSSICDDIEQGTLNPELPADSFILNQLSGQLRPDPGRAGALRREFRAGMEGIARRIWPGLRFARMLTTGGFAQHSAYLRAVHLRGVPQLSQAHAASEGFLGFNLSTHPDVNTYTAMITYAFLEFIPVQHVEDPNPRAFLADELRESWSYEIVLTSPMGFYRYRTGDIVRVVGHFYEAPIYNFEYRLGQVLNVGWEKTSEKVLYETVRQAIARMDNVLVTDFTATEEVNLRGILPDAEDDGKCYCIFIELESKSGEKYLLNSREKRMIDETMCEIHEMYEQARINDSISCMKVYQLLPGTFLRLKESVIDQTQSQQYKLPRVIRDQHRLRFIVDNIIDN